MSLLARSLLALAAAALLQGACAAIPRHANRPGEPKHCATVVDGHLGIFQWDVMDEDIAQRDSVINLPPDRCPFGSHQVGVEVTVCDPFGPPPQVTLMDGEKRVHVTCSWGQGQTCPDGLHVKVRQNCNW